MPPPCFSVFVMNVISFCIEITSCKHVIFCWSIWWNQETLFWSCEVLKSGNGNARVCSYWLSASYILCVFRQNRYSFSRTCLAPNFQRLAHKQNHFHKHIIGRQIKHTGDLCAPLPKHKSTSSNHSKHLQVVYPGKLRSYWTSTCTSAEII